jgi:ribosomal protein L37AE/L43A
MEGTNMTGGIRKPSESEEEYIARIEYQRRKKVEEEKHREMAEQEKRRRKELHFMHCPKCGMKLIEVDYKSLKIDRCSACDGIWLDAGELEAAVELEKGLLGRIFGM